ncbi:aldolase [Bosea caraganae]|uniref:Aldolase n=2 Tax=Bosea caraganae TaxID=2763117 RepID=A0A370KZB5_9HYPH|nr:aldolase/citrate lyase family protein [Bosea caraganae]RDJ20349.1 aldolase [Bosea caraganae]RDJ26570.1 aldolase [Bosea caraganae]
MPVIQPRNHLKDKLARDEVVTSMAVRLVDKPAIAALAAAAGFDTIYVDLEHSPISLQSTSDICIAAMAVGVTPFVRVPSISSGLVSRVLDGGALGIVAPHVETAAAAQDVVELVKFPPQGRRSDGGAMPHFGYQNPAVAETHRLFNEATSVVIMIESAAALERLDEIAAVPGVDLLFIGSNDLCADFGVTGDFDHPRLREAFEHTIAACRRHGKHAGVGGLAGRHDLIADLVAKGARYVSVGSDLGFLAAEAKRLTDLVHGFGR